MSKDIVIQASKHETRIAIVEDGKLAELYIENPDNARTIGDIYLGRVRNVMPSIQAAFVNIGQKQDAFLHFSDVGETLVDLLKMIGEDPVVSDIDVHVPKVHRSIRTSKDYDSSPSNEKKDRKAKGSGKKGEFIHPARYLRNGERALVQIVKEPIQSKGSRITTHVTLAGRFLVLVPFGDYVAVSKKIWSARERKRLQTLGRSILPDGFGLIIRTVAAGKDAKTLHTDLSLLIDKWDRIKQKLDSKPSPPKLLHQDVSMVSSVIRDLFTDDFDRILIDDHRLFRSIQTYIRAVAPALLPAVKHHETDKPIFEAVGVDKAMAEAFSSRVDLPSGGYVIIEHTEAMHVIDVNSGRAGRGESQEDNSLKVDLEAASAIAHQLRLRDLGGIIVVDFIDLREDKNRNKVVNRLKQEFRKDRAVTKVLPMSDFGLIQITRQRLRPSITTDDATREAEQVAEEAPKVQPAPERRKESPKPPPVGVVMERLDADLAHMRKAGEKGPVKLTVHPFQAAYLKKGIPNRLNRLRMKHRFKIVLEENESQRPTAYKIAGTTTSVDSSSTNGKKKSEERQDKKSDEPQSQAASKPSNGSQNKNKSKGSGSNRKQSGGSGSGSDQNRSNSGRNRSNQQKGDSRRSGGQKSGRGGRGRNNRNRGRRQKSEAKAEKTTS